MAPGPSMPKALERIIGSVIAARYVVEKCVGVGGMAAVFRGRHTTLDRAVAIKVLRPEYLEHGEVVARFDREARAASHFDHPNCIQVFDCGVTPDGFKFMVMPFLEGRELAKILGRPIPPSQVIKLAIQILAGLDYAHRQGVVHRDLKPDNIFVVRDHQGREILKVVDFGIAKIVGERQRVNAMQTKAGAIVGTPAYMSPEQAMGTDIDRRADLYSIGIVLYQMLTGRLPFIAADARGLLYQHVAEPPGPLPADVPEDLSAIVMRLLAKSPEERFETAAATIAALRYVADSLAADQTQWIDLLEEPIRTAPPRRDLAGGTVVATHPSPGVAPQDTIDPTTAKPSGERLERMSAALDDFLAEEGAEDYALRTGIFEPPPGGWDPASMGAFVPQSAAPTPPPDSDAAPAPAPASSTDAPPPDPPPDRDAYHGKSLTPHFSDTGFGLQERLAAHVDDEADTEPISVPLPDEGGTQVVASNDVERPDNVDVTQRSPAPSPAPKPLVPPPPATGSKKP